jgi:hypothetical protein
MANERAMSLFGRQGRPPASLRVSASCSFADAGRASVSRQIPTRGRHNDMLAKRKTVSRFSGRL